jgi:pilus assembly protein CpaE
MKPFQVLLVEGNAEDASCVREWLAAGDGQRFELFHGETLVQALDALATRSFDAVLVHLPASDFNSLGALEVVRRHAPTIPIVVLAHTASESLAMAAVERGAQDYLVKSKITGAALVRVLQYAAARQSSTLRAAPPPAEPGVLIGVLGAKGGVGCTTLACQMSLEIARQSGRKTLLVDLDPVAMSAAFPLNVSSRYSVLDATANLYRLDEAYLAGVVAATGYGVDLLQAPGAVALGEPLDADRVRHVLRLVRGHYRYTVVDLGRIGTGTMSLLDDVRELYLVSTGDFPELYETGRVVQSLREHGRTAGQVRLLLNRMSKAALAVLPDLESTIGSPVYGTISGCRDELAEAYATRRFFDENLTLRRQMAKIVTRLLGRPAEETPRGGLAGLIGLLRGVGGGNGAPRGEKAAERG